MNNNPQFKKNVVLLSSIIKISLVFFGLFGIIKIFNINEKISVYAINCYEQYSLAEMCREDNSCYWNQGCNNKRDLGVNCEGNNDWCISGVCSLDEEICIENRIPIDSQTVTTQDQNNNCSSSNCGNCSLSSQCQSVGCSWAGGACMPKSATTTETTIEDVGGDSIIPDYPTDPTGVNFRFKNATVGSIVSELLNYVFVIAGLILLVMLVMGGLGLMTAAGNPDKMKAGYGKITNALIGFLIIFISYFVVQLVETILGIGIL